MCVVISVFQSRVHKKTKLYTKTRIHGENKIVNVLNTEYIVEYIYSKLFVQMQISLEDNVTYPNAAYAAGQNYIPECRVH